MKAQNTVDKLMTEKLAALNGLPSDYAVNLESKWQLLETTLVEQRKSKRKMLIMLRAAAGLTLIAALSLLFMTLSTHTQLAPKRISKIIPPISPSTPLKKTEYPIASATKTSKTLKQGTSAEKNLNPVVAEDLVITQQPQLTATLATQLTTPATDLDTLKKLAIEPTTRKKTKTRYTQMDFGETSDMVTNTKNAPVYTNGLQFKLRPTASAPGPEARETSRNKSLIIKF